MEDKIVKSQLSFDILAVVMKITRCQPNKELRSKDIFKMIAFGIERGNNLIKIENMSKPETSVEIRRLINRYNLVSQAKMSTNAVTLSRICDTFSIITCTYLQRYAKNPTVSFSTMESISKNYPKVMMTSAFAFLIPNIQDEFCLLLKKAHMVHQYVFSNQISGKNCKLPLPHSSHENIIFRCDNNHIKTMSDVKKRTQAAINGSIIPYNIQIINLKQFGVIHEKENEIIVTEEVLEAVKVWEEMEKKYRDEIKIDVDGSSIDDLFSMI